MRGLATLSQTVFLAMPTGWHTIDCILFDMFDIKYVSSYLKDMMTISVLLLKELSRMFNNIHKKFNTKFFP
ncbi:hypothetical protein HS5_23800 [Acidianus sp. HS-5]|nr:hypothetical protein HS5_23800 [Acidianus sp. HS-5]